MCQTVIWKPDHTVPYVIHCLSDDNYFLHGSVIIKPDLVHEDDDPEDIVVFRFLMNRGHMFFGKHQRHTDTELWFTRDEDNHEESFYIHPMTDDELERFNEQHMRGREPLSKEGIVQAYEDELRFG